MLPIYLFALIASAGVLFMQMLMGGRGDADLGHELPADAEADLDADADAEAEAEAEAEHGGDKAEHAGDAGPLALVLSTRFWIFGLLAFGLSGTLLSLFQLTTPLAGAIIAGMAGIASGVFAVAALRALKRSSTSTNAHTSEAVGTTGRVLVSVTKGGTGKVRVVLKGQSVDLLAMTDEADIPRGEDVLISDIQGEVAHVSRRPPELL